MKAPIDTRRVGVFLLKAVLLFSLLCAAWPAVRAPYGRGFRAAGNALFGSFGAERAARFRAPLEASHRDVRIVLLSGDVRSRSDLQLSSERTGYRPSALALALFLATPGLRRRWRQALAGILAIQAFVASRVFLLLVQGYAHWKLDGPVLDAGVPLTVIDVLVLWTWQETTSNYLVPLLVWACLALRAETFASETPRGPKPA